MAGACVPALSGRGRRTRPEGSAALIAAGTGASGSGRATRARRSSQRRPEDPGGCDRKEARMQLLPGRIRVQVLEALRVERLRDRLDGHEGIGRVVELMIERHDPLLPGRLEE